MSVMGKKIDLFDYPVCNIFRPKLLKGQLCYQVDVNAVKDQVDAEKAIKHGLVVILDYNEDRTKIDNAEVNGPLENNLHDNEDKAIEARIYVETLGRIISFFRLFNIYCILLKSLSHFLVKEIMA